MNCFIEKWKSDDLRKKVQIVKQMAMQIRNDNGLEKSLDI